MKWVIASIFHMTITVAPLAGAWIEILVVLLHKQFQAVAPLAGAWIEIITVINLNTRRRVAPLAGAWIEMSKVTALPSQ